MPNLLGKIVSVGCGAYYNTGSDDERPKASLAGATGLIIAPSVTVIFALAMFCENAVIFIKLAASNLKSVILALFYIS